jgi:hypothetical protein
MVLSPLMAEKAGMPVRVLFQVQATREQRVQAEVAEEEAALSM